MANPHSLLTLVRFRLVKWLDPYPDKGEAWCIDCELNGDRTLILPASGHHNHMEKHKEHMTETGHSFVAIRANMGYIPGEEI